MLVEEMFLLLVVGLARLWLLVGVRMTDQIEEDMEVGVDQTEVVLEAEDDPIGTAFEVEEEGQKGDHLEAEAMGGRIKMVTGPAEMLQMKVHLGVWDLEPIQCRSIYWLEST